MIGAFALVFGMSAAVGAYLLAQNPAAAPKPETVAVVVAAADISRGQTLTADDVKQQDWPKEAVPDGAITDPRDVLDRTATLGLIKGEVVFDAKLAPKGAGRGLAAVIPPGMRAVTIQTPNVATGVAGFILPGNKVDVLLGMSPQGQDDLTGGGSTMTLLQNVEILAVDQRIEAPQDNKMDPKELRSVTLLVSPADAARLNLGQNKGTLHLSLRNHADTDTSAVEAATLVGLKTGSLEPPEIREQPVAKPVENPAPIVQPRPVRHPAIIRTLRGLTGGYVRIPVVDNTGDDAQAPAAAEEPAGSGPVAFTPH
jgi:pilus assembly protein CpaB